MIGTNLMPARRVAAIRRARRIRMWGLGAGALAALLGAALVIIRAGGTASTHDLDPVLATATASLTDAERALAAAKTRLATAQKAATAASVLSDQPDWGALLDLLASQLDDQTVYTIVSVSPEEAGKGGTKMEARPERLVLKLAGLAQGQPAVSRLVLGLEETRLFERVSLVESRRVGEGAEQAVAFSVACSLTDSAGGVR
ncbi:MAG: PilN domain-containing protein [Phycisphaerales bacterium]